MSRIHIRWVVVVVLGLLCGGTLASPAHGASFDCAKATTKVEHIICDDPEISRLDDQLAAKFKAATQYTRQLHELKRAQRRWLDERNACRNAACIFNAYQARLEAFKDRGKKEGRNVLGTDGGVQQDDSGDSGNEEEYRFLLTKGGGVQVCEAYLVRLNTTHYDQPPFCGRPENDSRKGFGHLNRVPLSATEVRGIYPIVWAFMVLANKKNANWSDTKFQNEIAESGQFKLSDLGVKLLDRDLKLGWANIWRYEPQIDIDNDGELDDVEIWQGSSLPTGVGGRKCGADISDWFPGDTLLRQPSLAFVMTAKHHFLDGQKTVRIFGNPAGGRRIHNAAANSRKTLEDFRPIGNSIGIFEYGGLYYFDTFLDAPRGSGHKRQKEEDNVDTLAVFLNKGGASQEVCEYKMTSY